jgi:hypothetical protein
MTLLTSGIIIGSMNIVATDGEHQTFHYHYSKGWQTIDHPLPPELLDGIDFQTVLRLMGYAETPVSRIGTDFTFDIAWYRRRDGEKPLYSNLFTIAEVNDVICDVFTSDFPSALELFAKLAPIAQAAMLQDAYQATEATRREEEDKSTEYHAGLKKQIESADENRTSGGS